MTGEVKGARSKRCLSRNKRSKPEKSTENELCPDEAASGTFTAVRSRQPASYLHPNQRSDPLENLLVETTEDSNSVDCLKGNLVAGTSKDHKNDAFDFCDDDDGAINDDDDESRGSNESCSNKRKRIYSGELEPSSFTNVVSKFKRARKALDNLKQPIYLEKCKDASEPKRESKRTVDKSSERNKKGSCAKTLSTTEGSLYQLHKVDDITDNMLPQVGDQKQNLNTTNQDKVDDVYEEKIVGDIKPLDDRKDCPRNQVCPVCGLTFSPTEVMDVVNKHINSCLDGDADGRNRESILSVATCENIGEDLFFCQLCQKDLSKMNSQRRQQHINRCCDQAGKAEEMPPLNTAIPIQLQCPICGKGFKSSKSRQTHLKKCAQEYKVGTNQLLEIVRREKQQDDSSSAALGTEVNAVSSTNIHPAQNSSGPVVKRKRRGVVPERDLDEETQLAMALSASMAPPPPPVSHARKGVKGKGKKNKGGSELPALLLRDDETAQRAVAMRAAQVLCTLEGNDDDDDDISCTPALAPSRLAQNIPEYQPSLNKEAQGEHLADNTVSKDDIVTNSDCTEVEDNLMDVNSGSESDKGEEQSKEAVESTTVVDPLLSKSFLNSLYDVDIEENRPVEMEATLPSPLWSLAAAKDQSSVTFYVPGLLPPASPRRPQRLPKQLSASEPSVKNHSFQNKVHEQTVDNAAIKEDSSHTASETTVESVAHVNTTENDECPEITPSQAVDVEMLLELVGEDDISNMSIDSQQMAAASGFCVDEQVEDKGTASSGVPKLLQDLSSMINNSYLSDVVFNLKDGQEMVAHSFILSLRSEVLAQLLKEQGAFYKETASGGRRVFLKFEDVHQSAFEVVLRHIYAGVVIIPEDCELDDVTNLAERFNLPCLLNACKKTQSQLKQACESQEDDGMDECIATDVAKLEENLWKSDNDDDCREDCQTSKDKDEVDFLNDDDIEEIMIFQTQSIQRNGSVEREDFDERPRLDKEEDMLCTSVQSKFGDDFSHESSSLTSEETEQKLGTLLEDYNMSRVPVEEGNVSHNPVKIGYLSRNPDEEGNVSRNPVKEGHLSRNPDEEGNVSRNLVQKGYLSRNPAEGGENIMRCDYSEEEEEVELIMSCAKGKNVEEEMIIENEQLPLPEESVKKKQLSQDKNDQGAWSEFEENHLLSRDDRVLSRASSIERVCVNDGEPISDLDDVEAQPADHVLGRSALERDLEQNCVVDEELSHVDEAVELDFELEIDADCANICNVSVDLLDDENEVEYEDIREKDVSDEIHETLPEFKSDENKDLDLHVESSYKAADETLSLPSWEGRWDDEEVFQGSPWEVTVPDDAESDDEMEEADANESITLISDNEEEVLDVSPPKSDITIVPETPRVGGRSSTKSSSTHSVSEEDDVSITGSSPSKSRKQLHEEANEFLSKLKQRAERGKGKRQGKQKSKKSGAAKKSPVESSAKHATPTKNSPRKKQHDQVGASPLPSNTRASPRGFKPRSVSPIRLSPTGSRSRSVSPIRTPPRDFEPRSVSPMQTSPRDFEPRSVSPMQTSPRGFKPRNVSPIQTSPRGFKPRSVSPIQTSPRRFKPRVVSPISLNEDCVVDVVTIGHSPPISPVLLQRYDDSPQASQTKRNVTDLCGRDSLGENEFDSGLPRDVEIVETCADKSEGDVYRDLALSTTSSPRDVMSPPVPSPSYSFLDHVSSPGSPAPYASPASQKIVLSPDPVSPSLPIHCKSPASESRLGACPQSNSPVSPSVCSFSSQIASVSLQDKRKDLVKNVDFEQSLKDKEKTRSVEVVEIDPNVPLMERLKAARRGAGQKMFTLKSVDEDSSDSNSDEDCPTKNEVETEKKESLMVSPQREKETSSPLEVNEAENISMGADFDFFDDGGFNLDINELNNVEGFLEDDNNESEECHSKKKVKEGKLVPQEKCVKAVAGKRKIPPSQRRIQDSDGDDDPQEAPKKRGKKTDTQSSKPVVQTVRQPVTPMPNYNEMATPVLKGELNKFGVRALPKKKMILKLTEIYDYTHQVEPRPQGSKTERAPNKGQPLSSNVAVSDPGDGVEGSGTASSDNSDEEDTEFGDCTVMIDDDVITASQQVNGGNLKERLICYIRDNKELYSKILHFQPLELVSLQQQIKSDGISCPLGKLVDFLDEQCITFTTAGTRAPRRRGRKKKGKPS